MIMNLKVLHDSVGPFRKDAVVPEDAFEGGRREVERLVGLGALAWTVEDCTEHPPAARTAVAEMTDDELVQEHERLRQEIEGLRAKTAKDHEAAVRSAVEQEVEKAKAQAKADADAQVAQLKAEMEAMRAGQGRSADASATGQETPIDPRKKAGK